MLTGKREGEGEYIWPDGGKYTGVYWDGKPHGYATRLFASGAVYVGEWQAGVMHGAGKLLVYEALSYYCMRP